MLNWLRSIRETIDDTTATIRGLFVTFSAIGILTIAIGQWLNTLNKIQFIAFYVVIGCLVVILGTYVVDWMRKRSIDRIPDLLAVLDQLTLEYIDAFEPTNVTADVMDGFAKVLGIEIGSLKAAVRDENKNRIEQEYPKVLKQYERISGKKTSENLQNLLLMSAYLNENKIGLKQITDNSKYRSAYMRIKSLQRRVPSAEINIKINEYWRWSEGLYTSLLTAKPSLLMRRDLIPPKIIAYNAMMRPLFEEQTAVLISAIRESIAKYKERNKYLATEKQDKKR